MNCRRRLSASALICLAVAAMLGASSQNALAAQLEKGQRVALVLPETLTPAATMARDDLVSFLQQSMKVIFRFYPGTVELSKIDEPTCIVFGTPKDNPLLARLGSGGLRLSTGQLGTEGLQVKTGTVDSKLVIALAGQTQIGASYAAYSFLENELGIGFFLDGNRIPTPDIVVFDDIDRTERPTALTRSLFYHYTWKHPHANSWRLWDFDDWKTSIDWMRRKRFNLLPMVHDAGGYLWGDVIFNTFPKIPINDYTTSQFVVDPRWRRDLTKKIFDYCRESGIQIGYNLFYSQVPEFFADYYPDIKYHELNMANVGIDADQPECKEIMRKYWRAIIDTYGIDDSHIYFVCSYKHERTLGGTGYKNKNTMTQDAYDILKELDPKAVIYVETWCWKYRDELEKTRKTLDESPMQNWLEFDAALPKDMGVVEWDVRRMHPDSLPLSFNGRPYMQLTHSNMEAWWPPNTHRNHPQWLIDYFGNALDNGAQGLLFFHIQANTNEIIADLAAKLGWEYRPDLKAFYRDYVHRRYGDRAAGELAESQALLADAVNYGANRGSSPFPEMMQPLVPPAYLGSAEEVLANLEVETESDKKKWIRDRLKVFRAKEKLAAEANLLARSVAPLMQDEPFFQKYVWELDYVAARYEGILNMYMAHLLADADAEKSDAHFERAMDSFMAVKELFRNQREFRMSELRNLEPNVPFTVAFLKDWETRGYWQPRVKSFHVIWERFDEFEKMMREMQPTPHASQK